MSNGKGNALVIISLIIGALGVGMGTYSIINSSIIEGPQGDPGEDGTDGINGTINNVVGIWETITSTLSFSFYFNFSDNVWSKEGFSTLTDGGTNLTLTKQGWYRFNMRFRLESLMSAWNYQFYIYQNGTTVFYENFINPDTSYVDVDRWLYVYCDGDDNFRFHGFNNAITDSFQVDDDPLNSQFVLEYVEEVTFQRD